MPARSQLGSGWAWRPEHSTTLPRRVLHGVSRNKSVVAMAFASWWYKTHVNEKTSGSSPKPGEKKEADEQKAASLRSSQPSRAHASGTAQATKMSASGATSKPSSMNPTETKAVKTEPEKSQSATLSVVHEKKSQEEKPKEHAEPKSQPQHASDVGSKPTHSEKAASRSKEQLTSEKSTEPKAKSQATVSVEKESAVAGVAATSGKPDDKKKEKKSLMPAAPVESKPDKPPGKSGIDAALDDLIDTLGEPEETNEDNTTYTGPEISDPMYSTYIEELGKREITIPPKYRELLAKKGVMGPPPDSLKPMGPDDAIDALSSDFTCSSPTAGGEKTDKQKSTEVLKAQSATVIRSAAPPQEKKRKVEEDAMSDQAVEALSASLGTREPEPELDLSAVKEVDEAKAKEERLKKCGEDDETVPSEYRLKPAMDKDGKPLLPKPEEKPKTLSESELIDELSEDFNRSKCKEKQSKPTGKTEKSQAAATAPVAEVVSATSMCSVQMAPPKPASSKSTVPDDAVEALAGSLGKKEPDPEEGKPVVDKIKEKAREEDREKLGEKEETIPPDYRLEEVKDKDGKPLLPKEAKKPLPPLSDDFLLDALSRDFSSPADTSSLKFDDAKLSAVVSEVVSQTPASATHAAGPPPDTAKSDKELDDALDKLSDSLGQRQPDPDENKPMEDKVKEKAKAEHRDKLGERDDTIPPEYRHLLDGDGQNKPAKPPTKKSKESKKPADDKDPIDVLSGDLDSCPSTAEPSPNTAKDKNKKGASSSKAPKNESKAKDSAKKTEEASKPKGDEKNTKKDDDKKTS
ncbi:calpastatin isoform X3 [Fukomys damarensis]|uniref:calpastatin isoform X3 n=2 Tax=Fukomys damarensis TaxID=885580 RepID=UPI00053FC93F|nr:calpastatin isoform X3 [Fukomys damarensis]